MTKYISHNPYTEQTLKVFETMDDESLFRQLELIHQAQREWSKSSFEKREALFTRLADLIKQNAAELAKLATLEMGKTYQEALAEVNKCTTACIYYAEQAGRILKPELSIADTGKQVTISYEPMGVVLGIFPWNFPYWQVIRSAVPVLMSGNAMLVKPAPNVPQCALALQQLFHQAGFPQHVISTLFITENQIAELIADERVAACTLTGSEKAGSAVASRAAQFIKKSVLELGGSDPFIALDDADLNAALDTAIIARFQNNGQSCIASKRFILHERIADNFLQQLTQKIDALVLGDPMHEKTNIGPIARADLRNKLAQQVNDSIKAGAQLYYQHAIKTDKGYFYPPTILTDIPQNSPAYSEELFGPVISVFIVKTDEEAIRIANDTVFGLGGSVWSTNKERANNLAKQLNCGQVFINGLVKSHTAYPFGGAKHSGIGRELGEWGLKEFCNVKAIWQ
jgi:succinate-semialdehyde dehydrogenase/glutarate-semialdehyde dehydrogenase